MPPATPLRLPKPPFVQINNSPNPPPTRLAREDEVAEGAEHSAEMEAQAVRERKAYAASQDLAKRVCETAVKELLVDTYPKLTPEALAGVRALLLGDASLASIAKHYKLDTKVPPVATGESQVRHGDTAAPGHQAALLRTYLAALHSQEGERFAYQWIRQCFRSVLNNSYDELRAQQKEEARAAREKEILSPMSHLRNFVRHRPGIAPEWNIAVRGDREEYRAEIALFGLRTSGTAKTVRMAKQNAAEKLMHLIWRAAGPEDVEPDLPDYPKLLVLWAGQSEKQRPQFHCQVEKAPVVRCTLDVQGKQFVERGLSKRSARFLAAKSAIEELKIDVSSVRMEPLRRPSQVRRREKFQELLLLRSRNAKSEEVAAAAAAAAADGNENGALSGVEAASTTGESKAST